MNRLSVERRREGRDEVVVPIIDGRPLNEMLDRHASGLSRSLVAPPSRQWLGRPVYEEDGRAVVLDGTCGVAGCCGVFARITLTADTVRWSDFFTPGEPPLPTGLAFEFDRDAYEATLAAVGGSVPG